ncbi:MAG: Dolichyl-phosphate-mannose-protein mannosyltransferase [Candidatus Parcubacteria bacterium]|jgi:4-amino-4-deoxy-L-arabinose transferase-like glycosyltransferase|nr:Dolichyl-phosphate-mannose-protein mannosyltransferase [Candidatus Parcubacteria bacterium]
MLPNISRKTAVLSLSIITLIGIYLRVHALSPYKFYPDSYQPLLVAQNIRSFGGVIGVLGTGGILYPDFFSWTRPMYPLLIDLVNVFTNDPESAAHAVALIAGIASIPIAFLFLAAALRSEIAGLLGALLLALAYDHAVWGGFIFSDTTGVFFLFLALWLFVSGLDKDRDMADWRDLLTGAAFACAVLARYEYAVLILPFISLFFLTKPRTFAAQFGRASDQVPSRRLARKFGRLISMAAAACAIGACAYFFLSPFVIYSASTSTQVTYLFDFTGRFDLSGLLGFVHFDIAITLLAIFGTISSLLQKRQRRLIAFCVLSAILLGYLYYSTNPAMQRYFIHLIPFILVPAAIGSAYLFEKARKSLPYVKYLAATVACLLLLWQFRLTYAGLHNKANGGYWFTPGYEELAAKEIIPDLPPAAMIIVSLPEPYFFITGHPTQSIADAAPFVYISDTLDDSAVTIVEDEGMRRIFPVFSGFIAKNLGKYIVKEIPFKGVYRYADLIEKVDSPIRLYSIRLGELKSLISAQMALPASATTTPAAAAATPL